MQGCCVTKRIKQLRCASYECNCSNFSVMRKFILVFFPRAYCMTKEPLACLKAELVYVTFHLSKCIFDREPGKFRKEREQLLH